MNKYLLIILLIFEKNSFSQFYNSDSLQKITFEFSNGNYQKDTISILDMSFATAKLNNSENFIFLNIIPNKIVNKPLFLKSIIIQRNQKRYQYLNFIDLSGNFKNFTKQYVIELDSNLNPQRLYHFFNQKLILKEEVKKMKG